MHYTSWEQPQCISLYGGHDACASVLRKCSCTFCLRFNGMISLLLQWSLHLKNKSKEYRFGQSGASRLELCYPDMSSKESQCFPCSIPDTWRNVTADTADFKELIPEFYDTSCKGDFLLNSLVRAFGSAWFCDEKKCCSICPLISGKGIGQIFDWVKHKMTERQTLVSECLLKIVGCLVATGLRVFTSNSVPDWEKLFPLFIDCLKSENLHGRL